MFKLAKFAELGADARMRDMLVKTLNVFRFRFFALFGQWGFLKVAEEQYGVLYTSEHHPSLSQGLPLVPSR